MATTSQDPVKLITATNELEAAMIVAALEREGIEAYVNGEYTAGFRAEAPGWPTIVVRSEDFDRARISLAAIKGPTVTGKQVDIENEYSRSNKTWIVLEAIAVVGTICGITYEIICSL